jgi:hypothetical protein
MDITSVFASQLLYFHRERNRVIGIEHDNQFVRGLRLFGYQLEKRQIALEYWQGVLMACQYEISETIELFEAGKLDGKQALDIGAMLNQLAQEATEKIGAIDG